MTGVGVGSLYQYFANKDEIVRSFVASDGERDADRYLSLLCLAEPGSLLVFANVLHAHVELVARLLPAEFSGLAKASSPLHAQVLLGTACGLSPCA